MKQKTLWVLVLALGVGVIAAGCGGDDDDGGDAPSKADYIAEADRICTKANERFEEAIESAPATADPDARDDFVLEEMVPLYRDEFEQLRELTPPEGDEETVAAIYDAGEQGVDQIEKDPSGFLESGAPPAVSGLQEASELASEYGFEVCGQGGG